MPTKVRSSPGLPRLRVGSRIQPEPSMRERVEESEDRVRRFLTELEEQRKSSSGVEDRCQKAAKQGA